MNRQELIDEVIKVTGQSKTEVRDCVAAIIHSLTGAISSGHKVTLVGFGTFERRNRAARTGVNPQNPKQKLKIAAAKVPAFRAGRELKDIVNGRAKLQPIAKAESKSAPKKAGKKAAPKKAAPKKAAKKSGSKKRR